MTEGHMTRVPPFIPATNRKDLLSTLAREESQHLSEVVNGLVTRGRDLAITKKDGKDGSKDVGEAGLLEIKIDVTGPKYKDGKDAIKESGAKDGGKENTKESEKNKDGKEGEKEVSDKSKDSKEGGKDSSDKSKDSSDKAKEGSEKAKDGDKEGSKEDSKDTDGGDGTGGEGSGVVGGGVIFTDGTGSIVRIGDPGITDPIGHFALIVEIHKTRLTALLNEPLF